MLQHSFYLFKKNGPVEAIISFLAGGSRQKPFHQEMAMQVGIPTYTAAQASFLLSVLTSQDDTVQVDYYL